MAAAADPISSSVGTVPRPESIQPWSLAKRVAFRLVCLYWLLYLLPVARPIAPWAAVHIFHLSGPVTRYQVTGSGDTTLDYIQNLIDLVLAIAGALLWSALDWKRQGYSKLHPWLILLLRYSLAFTLFGYGFAKVFPQQFPYPNPVRMFERFGDFSPMGVLWSFMGASQPYTFFGGLMELLGAYLLLFRRTATLGALVSAGVLLNVVVLNFCYDVPVKLFSTNLFLIAVTIATPDAMRLIRLLVLRQSSGPLSVAGPVLEQRWAGLAGVGIKIALIASVTGAHLYSGYRMLQTAVLHPAHPPIYGIYDVESFVRDGKEVPPLTTDRRWRTFIATYPTSIQVKMIDDSTVLYGANYDLAGDSVTLKGSAIGAFQYTKPDADHLILDGKLDSNAVVVKLARIDPGTRFLLMSRGFHWITEFPFNR